MTASRIEAAHESEAAAAAPRGGRRGRLWQVLALLLALYVIEQDVEAALWQARLVPGAGQLGAAAVNTPEFGDGVLTVSAVEAQGPAERAGVLKGDRIRFTPTFDYLRHLRGGERVRVRLDRDGARRDLVLTAAPRPMARRLADVDLFGVAYILSDTIPALIGAFILWRSRGQATVLLLGTALVTFGLAHFTPQMLVGRLGFLPFYLLGLVNFSSISVLFTAFSMRFAEQAVGRLSPAHWRALGGYGLLCAAATASLGYCLLTVSRLPLVGNAALESSLVNGAGFLVSIGYMAFGWRRAQREAQRRHALMLLATSLVGLAQLTIILIVGLGGSISGREPLTLVVELVAGVVAPLLFAYAILRHRVFDLGFAINRTLIYALVSAILLVTFALLEWAIAHFVRIEGREKNALLDAGLALLVSLTFHRVFAVVEHVVETLFYRRWRAEAAALRRFVAEAEFMLKPDALMAASLRALARFTEGAAAAIYLPGAAGDYVRVTGCPGIAPDRLDPDLPALVTLRATHAALDLDHSGSPRSEGWTAALALPMINRTQLTGLVLVAPKPAGYAYRPDEIDALALAVTQVGLNLHSLKLEALERRVVELERRGQTGLRRPARLRTAS